MERDEPNVTSRRRLALVLLGMTVAGTLAACGKKGAPEPPEDADPRYPRPYPIK
jgi:hypothetical protein